MMTLYRISASISALCVAVICPAALAADTLDGQERDRVVREVELLDARLFNAYNKCDLQVVRDLVAEDLEFYDDRDGLSLSRESLLTDLERYICGKVRRELLPQSLEVHPIPGYGAVQLGLHRFCGAELPICPEGHAASRFVHIWRKSGAVWTLTRAISFAHHQ